MDSSDTSAGRSPRRELQGPRPTPLRVQKDSRKIKKPRLAMAPPQPSKPQPDQPRPPVIIYTVSPKTIHISPVNFKALVQRLTGLPSSSSSVAPSSNLFNGNNSGAMSPAVRYATVEKARSPEGKKQQGGEVGGVEGIGINYDQEIAMMGSFPGILSPGPASLPPIPSNFFSSPSDPSPFSFFHDFSPTLHGSKNYIESSSFMPRPLNFVSPRMSSPTTPSIDLFNNFLDY